MEDLTKQQIILLTLFVSFVTSMATGIVTVSLMDQSPQGVTQTINRVVERTIERVVMEPSDPQAAAVVSSVPSISDIVKNLSDGLVKIKTREGTEIVGTGIILSEEGLVLTDKSVLGLSAENNDRIDHVAILSSGESVPLQLVQSEIVGDIAFALLISPKDKKFRPVTWASSETSIKLGETVYALSKKNLERLETGIVKIVGTSTKEPFETSIDSPEIPLGAPLFTLKGEVIGFKTHSLSKSTSFYPVAPLRFIAPQITR